jgi:hypothetical protein
VHTFGTLHPACPQVRILSDVALAATRSLSIQRFGSNPFSDATRQGCTNTFVVQNRAPLWCNLSIIVMMLDRPAIWHTLACNQWDCRCSVRFISMGVSALMVVQVLAQAWGVAFARCCTPVLRQEWIANAARRTVPGPVSNGKHNPDSTFEVE